VTAKPPVNGNVDHIADQAKFYFAQGVSDLSELHYRLAELAGTGRLDPDESMRLQQSAVRVWEALYFGTVSAVRDRDTPDCTWDEVDNTYSTGRPVLVHSRIEPEEHSNWSWKHNSFMLGEGSVADRRRGVIFGINPISAEGDYL